MRTPAETLVAAQADDTDPDPIGDPPVDIAMHFERLACLRRPRRRRRHVVFDECEAGVRIDVAGDRLGIGTFPLTDLSARGALRLSIVGGHQYVPHDQFQRLLDEGNAIIARPPDPSGIYFIQSGAFIKIGWSSNIPARLLAFQMATPFEIVLLGYLPIESDRQNLRVERLLHQQFVAHHHRLEWFHAVPELLAYVARFAKPLP